MNLIDGEYYDATIIGVTYGTIGERDTPVFRFAVRMTDGTQQEVLKFATAKSLKYTRENLQNLGCSDDDLTGADWMTKINRRLSEKAVQVKAEMGEKRVRLTGIFPRSFIALENVASPFGEAPSNDLGVDGFDPPPFDDEVPY